MQGMSFNCGHCNEPVSAKKKGDWCKFCKGAAKHARINMLKRRKLLIKARTKT